MNDERPEVLSIAPAVLRLLQGPLYNDESKLWRLLQDQLRPLQEWFGRIGLDLMVLPEEGLAYLTQPEDDLDTALPRLVKRQPLGFETTLLAVLLREALEEFDLGNADSRDLFLSAKDIRSRLLPFLGESFDERRVYKQFERYLLHLVKLGFLREVPGEGSEFDQKVFQVMRILKAKINNEKLEEIRERLGEALKKDPSRSSVEK